LVVADGATRTEVPETVPTPGVIVNVGDPLTPQISVLVCPAISMGGLATKLRMDGGFPVVTVTEAFEKPKEFVAVSV
jgi:hypothetical protein